MSNGSSNGIAPNAKRLLWAGFFAYKHVPYSTDLWWEFAWRGNAPR